VRPRPAVLVVAALALSVGLVALDPNVLTAVATAVLTVFAGLQIASERTKRRSEERSADARLSVNAFALRKSLADWIARSRLVGWGDAPAKHTQDAIAFAQGLQDRLEQGLVDAAGASSAAAAQMRTAYANWQRAMILFDEYLGDSYRESQARIAASKYDPAAGRTVSTDAFVSPADANRLSDARECLHACYLALAPVVEPELAAEAKRLGAGPPI